MTRVRFPKRGRKIFLRYFLIFRLSNSFGISLVRIIIDWDNFLSSLLSKKIRFANCFIGSPHSIINEIVKYSVRWVSLTSQSEWITNKKYNNKCDFLSAIRVSLRVRKFITIPYHNFKENWAEFFITKGKSDRIFYLERKFMNNSKRETLKNSRKKKIVHSLCRIDTSALN